MRSVRLLLLCIPVGAVLASWSCGEEPTAPPDVTFVGTSTTTSETSSTGGAGGTGGGLGFDAGKGGGECPPTCSKDLTAVVDCNGELVEQCAGTDGCDLATATCVGACDAAESNKLSVGCEYYATFMDQLNKDACFAAFVANTWSTPAHITVERGGVTLPVADFAHKPQGAGATLTYAPYDAQAGIGPGEVVVLLLAGADGVPAQGNPVCPLPSAVGTGAMVFNQSGKGKSFRIRSDVPVVVYQINPYGGGSAATTGASLLLPTSAWGTNYIGVNAYDTGPEPASMNIVAKEDGTKVTMVPPENIVGGGGLPPGPKGGIYTFTLNAGEHAQLTQPKELTGAVIQADKPIGLMAGARCSMVPAGVYACDHMEQMIPPIRATGSEYVAVSHRPRSNEPAIWRLFGLIDGTTLSYSSDVGGPKTLEQGQTVELSTTFPFRVWSQDEKHPFLLMAYMSGGSTAGMDGVGDADGVLMVPPAQYMHSYVFFADPTYPETNLVVVRAPDEDDKFRAVTLKCAGTLDGWKKVGGYEYTRVDLTTGDFEKVGGCSTGRHEIFSQGRFGLWVWGWGSPKTKVFTKYVSYGYPGGMNVRPINDVVIPPK